MQKYYFPAVFTPEADGKFSVDFPDLAGCYTCGDDMADAIIMSEDVLAMTLCEYEQEQQPVPVPSAADTISLKAGEFINYIACDTMAYRMALLNQSDNDDGAYSQINSHPDQAQDRAAD